MNKKTWKSRPQWSKRVDFLSVPLEGDKVFETMEQQLPKTIRRSFFVARIPILASDRQFIVQQWVSHNALLYISVCPLVVRLSERISEYFTGTFRDISSTIQQHLLDSSYQVKPKIDFKSVPESPAICTRGLCNRLLMASEAKAIRLMKPELCKQNNRKELLLLPWPEHSHLSIFYIVLDPACNSRFSNDS